MKCPYCGEQMTSGVIRYDGRSGLRWSTDADNRSGWDKFYDSIGRIGQLTAAEENSWARGSVSGNYCPTCKKLIIETDIVRS